MIDCHAHLDDELFNEDLEAVIQRAVAAGVSHIVSVPCHAGGVAHGLNLARRFPGVILPCAGLHPENFAKSANAEQELADALQSIHKHQHEIVAVGEVGLDFSPWILSAQDPEADKNRQRDAFARQIELAIRVNLPLNVHSRNAGRHAIDVLLATAANVAKQNSVNDAPPSCPSSSSSSSSSAFPVPVLLHAFDGKPSVALRGVQAGFFFSIPPSVIRSEHMQKLVRAIPLSHWVLETDSPALAAEKNLRNEPAHVRQSLRALAELKGVSEDEALAALMQNQRKLFPKLYSASAASAAADDGVTVPISSTE